MDKAVVCLCWVCPLEVKVVILDKDLRMLSLHSQTSHLLVRCSKNVSKKISFLLNTPHRNLNIYNTGTPNFVFDGYFWLKRCHRYQTPHTRALRNGSVSFMFFFFWWMLVDGLISHPVRLTFSLFFNSWQNLFLILFDVAPINHLNHLFLMP